MKRTNPRVLTSIQIPSERVMKPSGLGEGIGTKSPLEKRRSRSSQVPFADATWTFRYGEDGDDSAISVRKKLKSGSGTS